MIKKVFLCTLVLLYGCSSVKQIASSSQKISETASSSKEKFEFIHKETDGVHDFQDIHEIAAQGVLEQASIIKETGNIAQAVTGVKDITPWWAQLLGQVMIGLSILGVVFGLWYLGVGALTKALFLRLGFISTAKTSQAKLFMDALDSNNKTTVEEAVAALRAKDPELDAAFRKVKRARKQTNTTPTGN